MVKVQNRVHHAQSFCFANLTLSLSPLSSYLRSLINKYSAAEKMYLLLDEEIKKLIFKESQIVPCHKLTPRQERICNEQCVL